MTGLDYRGQYRVELETALDAGRKASATILEFYNDRSASTYVKGDGSPVTDADLESDRVIRETIAAVFASDALLTEEGAQDNERLRNRRCWIVDPIDGTAQYVARTGQFDVLIALCVDGRPVVAVAAQPVTNRMQAAVVDVGAWELDGDDATPFTIEPPAHPPRLVTSKWYGARDDWRGEAVSRVAARIGAAPPPVLDVGYQSRRFSSNERSFDAFIGLPPVSRSSIAQEWDLACVDLITHEAGGVFTDCWGRLHRYNKRSTSISGGILASANADLHRELLEAIAPELPDAIPAPDPADDGVG